MRFVEGEFLFVLCYNRLMRRLLLAARCGPRSDRPHFFNPTRERPIQLQKDAPAQEIAPDVPDAIAVPAGLEPVLSLHAKGSQIYTCQAGADGKFAWTLKGPEAELQRSER